MVNAPEDRKQLIAEFLHKNSEVLAFSELDLKETDLVQMRIETHDETPIKMRPYRCSLNDEKIIETAIQNLLAAGIISRSRSPYSAPLVLVGKKDGSKRMCVDFRQLNKVTKPYSFPLPLIDSVFDRLGGCSYFSTIDLYAGFHCIPIHQKDREKTAFSTPHLGLFEWNRMPFGLRNAPAFFSEAVQRAFQSLNYCCMPFVDDVIIFSRSLDQHIRDLQSVFDRLKQHSLRIKLSKCQFLKEDTNHLGFVVNKDGIKPDSKKVAAIQGLAPPTSTKLVRSVLALMSWYRRFVPRFSKIAEPLYKLTRKHARFKWTDECQEAFKVLKEQLATAPLLAYPDMSKRFLLYCDSSETSVSGVLAQEIEDERGKMVERPLHFLSHKLTQTQSRWPIIEKELYAIVLSLQFFDTYLAGGTETVVFSDHKPLSYLLDKPHISSRKIGHWLLTIQSYNCKIVYIKGESNISDILSRVPEGSAQENNNGKEPEIEISNRALEVVVPDKATPETDTQGNKYDKESEIEEGNQDLQKVIPVNAINTTHINPLKYLHAEFPITENVGRPTLLEVDMKEEQSKDEEIIKIKTQLNEGKVNKTTERHFIILDDILYYISSVDNEDSLRLFIPSHLTEQVIKTYHDYGHAGIDRTVDTIKVKYYFPGLFKRVAAYIERCVPCQQRNLTTINPPMGQHEVNPYPFSKIAGDVQGPFFRTDSGNVYIYSVICCYSGYLEAFPIPDKSADTILHILLDEIFPRHSIPLVYLSDNGMESRAKSVIETLNYLNVKCISTSYYNPRGNSLVEHSHASLTNLISKKIKDNPRIWDLYIRQSVSAINWTVNTATQQSPFCLLYGRQPTFPIDVILKPRVKYLGSDPHEILLQEQHKAFTRMYHRMKRVKRERAQKENKKCKDVGFKVGQAVYLKNHTRKSKLDSRWHPYYVIIEQKSPLTYVIKNQLDNKTKETHARHLRLAKLDQWEVPKGQTGRKLRRATHAVTPESSDTDQSSEYNSSDNEPLAKVAKRMRKEREKSSDEESIPLFELARRLKNRDARIKEENKTYSSDDTDTDTVSMSEQTDSLCGNLDSDDERLPVHDTVSLQSMKINEPMNDSESAMQINTVQPQPSAVSNNEKVKSLFKALTDILD